MSHSLLFVPYAECVRLSIIVEESNTEQTTSSKQSVFLYFLGPCFRPSFVNDQTMSLRQCLVAYVLVLLRSYIIRYKRTTTRLLGTPIEIDRVTHHKSDLLYGYSVYTMYTSVCIIARMPLRLYGPILLTLFLCL